MKFLIVVLLALAAQGYASSQWNSLEEDFSHSSNFNTQRELSELFEDNAVESNSHWQSAAASLPGAEYFKTKVTKRIQFSNFLSGMQDLQNKIYQLADQKLEKCLKPNGQEFDRHCVGRTTGQVMQLIAAVENSNHRTLNVVHRGHMDKDN